MFPLFIALFGIAVCIAAVLLFKKSSDPPEESSANEDPSGNLPAYPLKKPVKTTVPQQKSPPVEDKLPPWALSQPNTVSRSGVVPTKKRSVGFSAYAESGPMSDIDTSAIHQKMEQILQAASSPIPTKSQWQMILSKSRATRVIAGAGSGKSTALSLRVVFLHKYLGIPLEEISVVTFTRASRADMVQKLLRDLALFGVNISENTGKRVVRTFHSMILGQAAATTETKFIEHIGSESEQTNDTDDLGTLNPRQLDYLRKIYADAYHDNKVFRKSIGLLLLEKISAVRQSKYTDTESLERAMAVAEPRDALVAQAVTDAWLSTESFNPRVSAISWEPAPLVTSRGGWYANGRILSSGTPLVLGCGGIAAASRLPIDSRKYPIGGNDKDRTLGFINNVRLKVLATVASERYLYIETEADLRDLYTYIDWVQPEGMKLQGKGRDTFPAFSIRIPGDTSSASIFECLHSLGTFIASMGLPVPSTAIELGEIMREEDCLIEAHICNALSEFWPALHQSGHSTYNELFMLYSNNEYSRSLPTEVLQPMKHLLIDEFQDISGQIIKWIKAVHTVLQERGENPSVMVVGDDWQSVYGWRGSDPEFLIRFDDHFGESSLVVMNENYRSGQHIINSAELLVNHLKESALQKHGVSSGHAAASLGHVELSYGDDKSIQQLIDQIRRTEPSANIFIVSRTNEGLVPFRRYAKDNKITLLTMHRAKGLEADHVIIKGDCSYANTSNLKNAIYQQAGLKKSYDEAQQDETLRLAYVAITRAKHKAYWFGEPVKPEGAFLKLAQHIKPVEVQHK